MEIFLTEASNKTSKLQFPSLPESLQYGANARYQSYDLIKTGNVRIPNGSDVSTISWRGTFFGSRRKKSPIVSVWKSPKSCKDILEKWRDKGTNLILLITDLGININVTIQSLDVTESGAHGDIDYSISLIAVRELQVYTTSELKIQPYKPRATTTAEKYTVKKGDNLWSIAQKKLGNGARNKEIYNLNKDIIEKSARKYGKKNSNNGWWIYPGDVYTLPKK